MFSLIIIIFLVTKHIILQKKEEYMDILYIIIYVFIYLYIFLYETFFIRDKRSRRKKKKGNRRRKNL